MDENFIAKIPATKLFRVLSSVSQHMFIKK